MRRAVTLSLTVEKKRNQMWLERPAPLAPAELKTKTMDLDPKESPTALEFHASLAVSEISIQKSQEAKRIVNF